jgi:hypothetical protein
VRVMATSEVFPIQGSKIEAMHKTTEPSSPSLALLEDPLSFDLPPYIFAY